MIALDTNILSALMQQRPDPLVVGWLDAQQATSVWLTSITVFEARYGLALMPAGKRREALQDRLERLIHDDLGDRVLPFEARAADCAASLAAARRSRGCAVDVRDTLIAGIVIARGATLATRNVRHFDDLPVPVIDPAA